MSRSVLRTELTKDRSDKGPNWTSTSVLDSKRTEVARDRSGCTPYKSYYASLIHSCWFSTTLTLHTVQTTTIIILQLFYGSLDLLEQEIVSSISWAICTCTSPQTDNHSSIPPQFFTGQMPFLLPNQQRQSTEGLALKDSVQDSFDSAITSDSDTRASG